MTVFVLPLALHPKAAVSSSVFPQDVAFRSDSGDILLLGVKGSLVILRRVVPPLPAFLGKLISYKSAVGHSVTSPHRQLHLR
jgi:hypothetical protein